MKLARFLYKGDTRWGIVEDDTIVPLGAEPFTKIKLTAQRIPLKKAVLLAPATATKVVLIGLNYKDHARELKMKIPRQPLMFLKPSSSIIGHRQPIIYPQEVKRLDYEAELAVIIGRLTHCIQPSQARRHILGYSCLNDVTARDLQRKDIQWTRAKSFDTFCPLGPWLETDLEPSDLKIKLYLNGKLKQSSSTANFIFPIDYLVSFISQVMTLFPGDVISTGTPAGVGRLKKGDTVEVEIERVGRLKNFVA